MQHDAICGPNIRATELFAQRENVRICIYFTFAAAMRSPKAYIAHDPPWITG
jgi:hypothetical protein